MNALAAVLTADAPRWLVFTLLGLVAASYAACGLLTLVGRARARTRRPTPPPFASSGVPPARGLVITIRAPHEGAIR